MRMPLVPGTILHERYTVNAAVQVGRDGALYLANDALGAAKVVAILENSDVSMEAQSRFDREARILASLEHPSLPLVIDRFEESTGRQYLVLLEVEGQSVAETLSQDGALRESQVLSWFGRILHAVAHLHSHEPPIVHGHITPASIVIAFDGVPHLTGLVDVAGLTRPGATPAEDSYMAPEQYQGEIDERSDIYALGATLYALLTGRPPTSAPAQARGEDLPAPHQVNAAISPAVEAAILKAMALEPDQRFAGPAEFWQTMTEAEPEPRRAGAADSWEALRQLAALPEPRPRRLLPVALLVGVGSIALVLALGILWQRVLPRLRQAPQHPPTVTPTSLARPTLAQVAARPSATLVPTATLAPTTRPTLAPSPLPPAPTPTLRLYPAFQPTAPPRWFPPPVLISPGDGFTATGEVEFRWSWPHTLAGDEYFDLQVWRVGTEPHGIAWCKDRFYRASGPPEGPGNYHWRLRIVRGVSGQVQGWVSDPSAGRGLDWRVAVSR